MSEVVIYTTMMCPDGFRAKQLLEEKGVNYTEIDVGMDPDMRAEMLQRSGGKRTVPQIFIAGKHIGGSDELYALDRGGKLDPLLQSA